MSRDRWDEHPGRNCADRDVEEFFPPPGAPIETFVKAICRDCPVRLACLRAELKVEGDIGSSNRWGVRGGAGPLDRAAIAREGIDPAEWINEQGPHPK